MRRIGTWTTAAVLGAVLLAGCSDGDSDSASDESTGAAGGGTGGDGSSYCETVKGFPDLVKGLGATETFDTFREATEKLAADAPDEVAGEWEKIEHAFDVLADKLDEAGITLEQLSTFDLTAEQQKKLATIEDDVTALGDEVDAAGSKITEHAKAECGIDLDSPSASPSPSS